MPKLVGLYALPPAGTKAAAR
jgi:hypothetical protein